MEENSFSVGQDARDANPSKCSAPRSSSGRGKIMGARMSYLRPGQFNLLHRYPLRGLATMLAGTMMLVAVSIMMSFPNLNTYMISYMRARTNPEYSYSDFIWISQGRSIVCGKLLCSSSFMATLLATSMFCHLLS